jgi:Uma2 family endonuclease
LEVAVSTVQETRLTADELLARPDEQEFELVNGQLVERKMSEESSWIGGEIFRLLSNYVKGQQLGRAFPDGNGFQCFPNDSQQVRKPDAAVVLHARVAGPLATKGYTRVAPNLVVEVISPGDEAYEINNKIEEWLAAGVDEVWIVMPPAKTVTIHTREQSPRTFRSDEEIESVYGAPGFRCRVADFFQEP